MKKDIALKLGAKYDQQTIIYKDDKEFASFYTKNGAKKNDLNQEVKFKMGEIESKFATSIKDKNTEHVLNFDPYVVLNIAYTALVKNNAKPVEIDKETGKKKRIGDNPPNKFAFNIESVKMECIVETIYPTWTEAMARKNKLRYMRLL